MRLLKIFRDACGRASGVALTNSSTGCGQAVSKAPGISQQISKKVGRFLHKSTKIILINMHATLIILYCMNISAGGSYNYKLSDSYYTQKHLGAIIIIIEI